MNFFLIAAIAVYVLAMLLASLIAKRRIKSEGDFLVAGRSLSLPFASATLFATWFGAGTLLTATDEVAETGIHASLMEPLGAGSCLIIAGLFFAKPLWRLQLVTIADFFARKFGPKAEFLAIILYTPSYLAWISVQLMCAAQILHLLLGISIIYCLIFIALSVMTYILIGGMWSIALMDIIQVSFIIIGLLVLLIGVLSKLGAEQFSYGIQSGMALSKEHFDLVLGWEKLRLIYWYLTLYLVGSIGNIPGQDFAQRVFASKSEKIAKNACLIAGFSYMLIGFIPVALGMLFKSLFPLLKPQMVLVFMARHYLSEAWFILIVIAILATIFSTLDSSILATAAPISHNILPRFFKSISKLSLCKFTVVFITMICVLCAIISPDLFLMLEASYSSGLVIFFVPVSMGLFSKKVSESAALASMFTGSVFWILDIILSYRGFSLAIPGAFMALIAYLLA